MGNFRKCKRFMAIALALLQVTCGFNMNALEVFAWDGTYTSGETTSGGGTRYDTSSVDCDTIEEFKVAHPEIFSDPNKLPFLVSYNEGYTSSGCLGDVTEVYYVDSAGTIVFCKYFFQKIAEMFP